MSVRTATEGTIWLERDEGVSVSIDREQAMSMSEREFARFYRRHVLTASRKDARAWARRQVAERSAAGASTALQSAPARTGTDRNA